MQVEQIDELSEQQSQELCELIRNEWWSQDRRIEDLRRALDTTDEVIAFAERPSGRIVACVRILTDYVYKALVLDVVVAPSHRGMGLGAELMDAVINHPRLKNVKHFELYCKNDMVTFYKKWDFTPNREGLNFMRRATVG